MYFMYVDDTGDPGNNTIQTTHFGLVGLVLHSDYWSQYLEELIAFRQRIRKDYGLKMREEIHAARFFTKPGKLSRIEKWKRLEILKLFLLQISSMRMFRAVGVLIDKRNKAANYPFFTTAWGTLMQRYNNTLAASNFPGPLVKKRTGIVFTDATNLNEARKKIRQIRRYNPIPNKGGDGFRNLPLKTDYRRSKYEGFVFFILCAGCRCGCVLSLPVRESKFLYKEEASAKFLRNIKSDFL
jgi:hypothetical protein